MPSDPCPFSPPANHANHDAGWCCGAWNPRREKHCGARAGWGTDHAGVGQCRHHLGTARNQRISASRILARQACDRLGIPVEVDPGEALLLGVWETAGNVEFYRSLVAQLPTHPEDDAYDDGRLEWQRGEPGIYGRTYHQSGVPTGEAKRHILVQMYDDERDRLVRYVSEALKANVEERRVRLAERDATQLFRAVQLSLEAMGLADRFQDFRTEFARHLRSQPPALSTGGAR